MLVAEYYSPNPQKLNYRGYKDKLFKRDFAKELWNRFPKLKLLNYGFHWKEDPKIKDNCDNQNWFLFRSFKIFT